MENIYMVLEKLRINAEKSEEETNTRKIIREFMGNFSEFSEEQIGNSLVYSHIKNDSEKAIAIRADFDAVLTDEGVYEHRCGHHGHTAILLDFASKINKIKNKNIILIFQAAEEIATGALDLINNGFFDKYKPDILLGFHNFPGFKENEVIIRSGNFNNSVIGFKCIFSGKPSHAAYPEQGISPVYALARLVNQLENMESSDAKISITHIKMGEFQYGTSAGDAIMLGTIRSLDDTLINEIVEQLKNSLNKLGEKYNLQVEIETSEYFKGVVNSPDIVEKIKQICLDKDYPVTDMEEIFRAGEDFGFYLDYVNGCYFGIGAGEESSDLHTKEYSFNKNNLKFTSELLFELVSGYY